MVQFSCCLCEAIALLCERSTQEGRRPVLALHRWANELLFALCALLPPFAYCKPSNTTCGQHDLASHVTANKRIVTFNSLVGRDCFALGTCEAIPVQELHPVLCCAWYAQGRNCFACARRAQEGQPLSNTTQ